jgi:hypothetical protein
MRGIASKGSETSKSLNLLLVVASSAPSGWGRVMRNPMQIIRLVTVSRASAPPCKKSTFARMLWYCVFAMIPAGIVANTNKSKNWNPKFASLGVFVSLRERK